MTREKMDWTGLMHIGLHRLGLPVTEFWDLTPHELTVKMGISGAQASVLTRTGFAALMSQFPDERESIKNG